MFGGCRLLLSGGNDNTEEVDVSHSGDWMREALQPADPWLYRRTLELVAEQVGRYPDMGIPLERKARPPLCECWRGILRSLETLDGVSGFQVEPELSEPPKSVGVSRLPLRDRAVCQGQGCQRVEG